MEMVPVPFWLPFLLLSIMFWRVKHLSLFVHSFLVLHWLHLKRKMEAFALSLLDVPFLRRLVAKCAGSKVMKEKGELLFPKQFGYGIKRGIEIAIHSARVYLSNLPHDHLILK